jgi:hypothetical protein
MASECDGRGRFLAHGGGNDEQPPEQPPAPLALAIAAAIARLDAVKLGPLELRRLTVAAHYAHPEFRDTESAEQEQALRDFADKIAACKAVLKRFEGLVLPDREGEAIGALPGFVDAMLAALAALDWRELEKQFNLLIIQGNTLSHPRPLQPMEYWLKVAFNYGWSGEETALLEIELMRDNSYTLKQLDQFGFVTNTDRKVNRLQMRTDAAPREDPWRQKWFEKMPPIQGQR